MKATRYSKDVEDVFLACLLAYGPRPRSPIRPYTVTELLNSLDRWDANVRRFLSIRLELNTGYPSMEQRVWQEYVRWLNRRRDGQDN